MKLTTAQSYLFEFVKEKHGKQERKYTGEPYWTHLYNVAELCYRYLPLDSKAVDIALCHDLFEDTKCTQNELLEILDTIGYGLESMFFIVKGVHALTDEFVSERYTSMNRAKRKELEAKRLSTIDPLFQSIKYADLIDNTSTITKYDPSFAKVYLKEKEVLLSKMNKGNPVLYMMARNILTEPLNQ